jgi:hypothetical protein
LGKVLGNPTTEEEVAIEIRGAEGQPLRLGVSNIQGQVIDQHNVGSAGVVERKTLRLGRQSGVYILQVSAGTQRQYAKIIKQ